MLAVAITLLAAQPPAAPKLFPPDAATAARITKLRAELDDRISKLPADLKPDLRADIAIYAKAAEWTVRHGEWNLKDSAVQTVRVLESGVGRVKELAAGRSPWREVRDRPVIRGFVSKVDGSVQPVAVTTPAGDWTKLDWQCDVVLHGRDNTLTEVKFIAQKEAAKPSATKRIVIEPFGRGNNAYRWAGETDVFEAMAVVNPDPKRIVLRGFSMGGAGTWHIGLHHPLRFAALQPGAGFTTTRGYLKLPDWLPPHVEQCFSIYDAVKYAHNTDNVPVVAYSGELDKQKAAADAVGQRLSGVGNPPRFVHLVAPGLDHKQPAEWVAKCDAALARHLPRPEAKRVQLVTHTARYGDAGRARIDALKRQYQFALLDVSGGADPYILTTNVRSLTLSTPVAVEIDGQKLPAGSAFHKIGDTWATGHPPGCYKRAGLQGPIDDAFMGRFTVVGPATAGWHPTTERAIRGELDRAAAVWDRYLRGRLPVAAKPADPSDYSHEVLFGDPASNPAVAEAVRHLPITWTTDRLEVNGVRYDPTTHYPVLIYPSRLSHENRGVTQYVVLNTGHTFGEAEFRGSNAQLYPRLGDWAVKKATGEVVASGLFDKNWQFVPDGSPKR